MALKLFVSQGANVVRRALGLERSRQTRFTGLQIAAGGLTLVPVVKQTFAEEVWWGRGLLLTGRSAVVTAWINLALGTLLVGLGVFLLVGPGERTATGAPPSAPR